MCPGRPPTALENPVGLRLDPLERPEQERGVQIALHAPVEADLAQRRTDRRRQSSPITSPPAAAMSGSRWAQPVAKWMVGTRAAASTRAEYGATNSR